MKNKIRSRYDIYALISCGCGCGQFTFKFDVRGRRCFFLKGHSLSHKAVYRIKDYLGYIRIYKPEHRLADSKGYVLEHRYLFELMYNCSLLPWAHIHHKNYVKDDNRKENLEGLTDRQHKAIELRKNNYYKKERGIST